MRILKPGGAALIKVFQGSGFQELIQCARTEFERVRLVKPKAYIVLNSGYEPSEALANELKAFVKNRLAPFKYPRWVEFVAELPKTATGKIQRFRLRESGQTEPLDPASVGL